MDLRPIWTMTLADLRLGLRDGSFLIWALAVPLALMVVFNFLFAGLDSDDPNAAPDPIRVGVVAADDDQVVAGWRATMQGAGDQLPVELIDIEDRDAAVAALGAEDEAPDAAVVFPGDFGDRVVGGQLPEVEVLSTGGTLNSQIVQAMTSGFLQRIQTTNRGAQAAGAAQLDGQQIGQLVDELSSAQPSLGMAQQEASSEQLPLRGYRVPWQASLFLFMTVGFGIVGLLREREQGTIARLESMPVRPGSILTAKLLTSLIVGVLATTVLLGAGRFLFGVDWGAIVPVALLVVVAVVSATCLVMVIGKYARTVEQANMGTSIVGMVLGVFGGAFFPITGDGLFATLSSWTPTAAFIRGLGITYGGGSVADLSRPLTLLGVVAVASLVLVMVLPNRKAA